MWDRVRQLGECGEYWMERLGRGLLSSEGGSPRLCQLRTNRLAPVSKFDYVLAHTRFMGSHKLSSFMGHWDENYPTIPAVMYTGIVHGPPTDARRGITWKTCTRVRWAQIVFLIASWTVATRGVFLTHVCRVVRWFTLQGLKLARVSMTLSAWVTLARCSHSVVILLS
jgi:hypothetical protein